MKKVIFAIVILFSISAKAQTTKPRLDFRFGVGHSLLGSGDYRTIMFENEVNYFVNNYFSASGSLGYGKSDPNDQRSASFLQQGLTLHVSPLKNTRRNDFRIGLGLSRMSTSSHRVGASRLENGVWNQEKVFERSRSFGGNLQIENTYAITSKIKISAKMFTQPYFNGDINSGILVKAGLNF